MNEYVAIFLHTFEHEFKYLKKYPPLPEIVRNASGYLFIDLMLAISRSVIPQTMRLMCIKDIF